MRASIQLISVLLLASASVFAEGSAYRVRVDETIVVPGRGAERIVLDSGIEEVLQARKGETPVVTDGVSGGDVFSTVFGIRGCGPLPFTKIYYYEKSGVAVFSIKGRVCAVAGLNNRITDSGVDLQRGFEFFRFSYGNRGLYMQRRGGNTVCVYHETGIAVFDDDSDDDIDLYLVFPAGLHIRKSR